MTKLDDAAIEVRLRSMYTTLGERQGALIAPQLRGSEVDIVELGDHRSRRRAWVAAAAVAVVVALVVASFAIVRASTGDAGRSAPVKPIDGPGSTESIFPTPGPHTGPELYLVPESVPAGYTPILAWGPGGGISSGGGGFPPTRTQSWIKLDSAGKPLAAFSISWQATDTQAEAERHPEQFPPGRSADGYGHDALNAYQPSVATEIAGKPGIWSEQAQMFGWHEGDQTLTVGGASDGPYGNWPEHLSRPELQLIADQVVPRGDGGFTLRAPLEGFRLAGEESSWHIGGTTTRQIVYSDGAGHGFSIALDDQSDLSPGATLAQPEARLVTVRGLTAVLSPYANFATGCIATDMFLCHTSTGEPKTPSDKYATYVQWLEADGTLVTVTSVGLDESAVLDIARNLHEVGESEWQQLVASAPNR